MKTISPSTHGLRRGFTLAESVIALGILVVLITGFLAVFGPAATAIRRTLSAQEASRLQATLERELGTIRPGTDESSYDTPFEKAFDYIATSHQDGRAILVYNYRGSLLESRDDGTAEPLDDAIGVAGQDYVIHPMVRRLDDPLLEDDISAVIGRVYFVKLTQLIYEGEALRVTDEIGTITDPIDPGDDLSSNPSDYPEAVIALEAQFFVLPTRSYSYIDGPFDPANFERPVFRRNIGIQR